MKFKKSGRHSGPPATGLRRWRSLLLVSAASLGVASFLTACEQLTGSLTADYVYVTSALAAGSNQYGQIDVFKLTANSGHMEPIPASPFPSGGRNPVAEVVNPDFQTLYVVNKDDNTIVQFTIGSDGKLYPQNTVNTPGIFPVAVAVSGSNLFVADTYEPLPTCSSAAPCPGSVAGWPLKSDALDRSNPFVNTGNNSNYWPLTIPGSTTTDIITPVAMTASGSNLYVAAYDSTANTGYVFSFAIGSGTLTPLNGGVPTDAGVHPSAIIADPGGSHLYVTDLADNKVLGFTISGSSLTSFGNFATGNSPSAIVIDQTGKLAYVTNSLDSTVQGYTIGSNGALTSVNTSASDTQPVAIGIDPNQNQYLFTANFLASTVSGYRIDLTNGSLVNTQFSPYKANAQLTAVAAIPHKVTTH